MSTTPPVPPGPLSRVTALALTNRIRAAVTETWNLLLEAYEREAHKALGYDTWQEYVATEFDISRGQSYRLIDQARVTKALMEAAGVSPEPMSHARDTKAVIKVSAREAILLKPELEAAAAEVAEFVASGATPVQAVRQAVAKRQVPKPSPPEYDDTDMTESEFYATIQESTPAEILTAIPVESRITLTRGDILALFSHIEETDPVDAAQLLTERELVFVRRWVASVIHARQAALGPSSLTRSNVEPRFKESKKP